jgi:hypothetical protein
VGNAELPVFGGDGSAVDGPPNEDSNFEPVTESGGGGGGLGVPVPALVGGVAAAAIVVGLAAACYLRRGDVAMSRHRGPKQHGRSGKGRNMV